MDKKLSVPSGLVRKADGTNAVRGQSAATHGTAEYLPCVWCWLCARFYVRCFASANGAMGNI